MSRSRRASRRAGLAIALVWLAAGCDVDGLHELASFVDEPYVAVGADVRGLDGPTLGAVLTEVVTHYRLYGESVPAEELAERAWLPLRAALPLDVLLGTRGVDVCGSGLSGTSDDIRLSVNVACAMGHLLDAAGQVDVRQRVLDREPVEVTQLDLVYRDVHVGPLDVDGAERRVTTEGDDGASVFTLDLVQDERQLGYGFRYGVLSGEEGYEPVFDYEVDVGGQPAQVRLANPHTYGAFATAYVIGADGTVACEVRDAEWTPGDPVKGTCDNGVSFGLPVGSVGAQAAAR